MSLRTWNDALFAAWRLADRTLVVLGLIVLAVALAGMVMGCVN